MNKWIIEFICLFNVFNNTVWISGSLSEHQRCLYKWKEYATFSELKKNKSRNTFPTFQNYILMIMCYFTLFVQLGFSKMLVQMKAFKLCLRIRLVVMMGAVYPSKHKNQRVYFDHKMGAKSVSLQWVRSKRPLQVKCLPSLSLFKIVSMFSYFVNIILLWGPDRK